MSPPLISRSPDLQRLREDGYDITIRGGLLLVRGVPYVTSAKEIARGTLVSTLDLADNRAIAPRDHKVFFAGAQPCDRDGVPIRQIKHQEARQKLGGGVVVDRSFSNKPAGGWRDYYEKMSTYVAIISGPAESLDPQATAKTYRADPADEEETVFRYLDTSSARAGIGALSEIFRPQKIAIVGLGGTGSYVLDLVAKTPVAEVHLYDGDHFAQHNAFRAPGAASSEEISGVPNKAAYFAGVYGRIHRRVIPHTYHLTKDNVAELRGYTWVFVCIDQPGSKGILIEEMESAGVPFIDVGMGLHQADDGKLLGIVRTTASTPTKRDHVRERGRISLAEAEADVDPIYRRNIQIADLNSLNAALAVIKWKKLTGFYQDLENEHSSTYSINVNLLSSDDRHDQGR